MRNNRKGDLQTGLSWFLVAYLTMLLGVLLAVHVLQPALAGPGSAWRSPVHQDRRVSTKQAAATPAVTIQAGASMQLGLPSPR
jgi:hypothetical protein